MKKTTEETLPETDFKTLVGLGTTPQTNAAEIEKEIEERERREQAERARKRLRRTQSFLGGSSSTTRTSNADNNWRPLL